MSLLVIDASVAVKWFVPEDLSPAASRLLRGDDEFIAPDLLFAEVASAVWKKARRGELSQRDAQRLVSDITAAPIDAVPCRALAADGHALAHAVGITVYDAMYLALAVRLRTQVVTADDRLHDAAAAFPPLAGHIRLLQ